MTSYPSEGWRLDRSKIYAAVKALDLREVLVRRGYGIGADGFLTFNPLRPENTPSIHVRSDDPSRWHDFGAEKERSDGDLIDFLMLAEGMTHTQAVLVVADIVGPTSQRPFCTRTRANQPKEKPVTTISRKPTGTPERDLSPLAQQAHSALLNSNSAAATHARDYLRSRGLDPADPAIRQAQIGVIDDSVIAALGDKRLRGHLLFPYSELNGAVPFYSTRATHSESEKPYRKMAGGTQESPFNLRSIRNAHEVIVVEGELDALSIMTALGPQTPVIATGGGRLQERHVIRLKGLANVFLLFDADDHGEIFRRESEELLAQHGIAVTVPPSILGAKDANEALVHHGGSALRTWFRENLPGLLATGDAEYVSGRFLDYLAGLSRRAFTSYPTGVPPIDDLLDGGYRTGLHVIGGQTGIGKTSFALSLAVNTARASREVIYVSVEQSKPELWSRIISAHLDIPLKAFREGHHKRNGDQAIPLLEVLRQHPRWPEIKRAANNLRIIEVGDALSGTGRGTELSDLVSAVRTRSEVEGTPPLVILDYLQRLPTLEGGALDPRLRVGMNIGFLQVKLVRDLGCTVVVLSSIGRAFYGSADHANSPEALLASLKETGDIEYTAYTAAILRRLRHPSDGSPGRESPRRGADSFGIEYSLVKNREGPIGVASLRWHPTTNQWSERTSRASLSDLVP